MNTKRFLDNILLFVHMLRRVGLPVSSEQAMDFSQALTLIDIASREQVYYAARSLLISHYEHLDLFDVLFNRFWRKQMSSTNGRGQQAPIAPRHQRQKHQPLLISYMASKARKDDPEIEIMDRSATFSDIEILRRKDFSAMNEEELQAIKRLMQEMRWKISLRKTRRYVSNNKGRRLHMRRVMTSAIRHGGVVLKLAYQERKIKQRPLVLIADISGSMEKYARLVLQFFYSVSHSLKNVECFVFGTRMTRITGQLKLRNIDRAIDEASREVVDWSGGTRIGESLQQFNQQWSRRVLRRGALVLVVSDGWEHGDTSLLSKEMRYLQLRCHRLIWLNPLLGKTNYQPLVEGMASALEYVDDFLAVNNLQNLSILVKHLEKLDGRSNRKKIYPVL